MTKHAAVALAEWLAITYWDQGIGVSCLCPMAVDTAMLRGGLPPEAPTPTTCGGRGRRAGRPHRRARATAVVEGLRDGRFLILPHPEVATFEQRRAADRDRWLAGMRRLTARLAGGGSSPAVTGVPAWVELGRAQVDGSAGVRGRAPAGARGVSAEDGTSASASADGRGASRALVAGRLEVRAPRPRGGPLWEPVAERAARTEQLSLWRP